MSEFFELVDRLCPEGVEWKPLYELANYEQPSKYIVSNTNYDDAFSTPVLTAGKTFILGYTNDTDGVYLASKKHPVIIFDDFTCAFKWVDFPFKVKSSAIKIITANEEITLLRYIFHMMGKLAFIPNLSDHQRLWISKYSLFKIPLPPLAVQREVVGILDLFDRLTLELTESLSEELELRKKQYAYYREVLLSFDEKSPSVIKEMTKRLCPNGIEWKTLDEVFTIRNGYTPSKANPDYWEGGTIPWFRMDDIRTNGRILEDSIQHITPAGVKGKLFEKDSIILATTATIGEHALLMADALANQQFTNFAICKSLKERLLPKFAFYYFFMIDEWCKKNTRVSSFPSVDMKKLKKQPFPLPPLEIQHKIVEILDKFDTLTTSLTEGIPAEIEARRKQYTYYRNKLLTFKELAPSPKE